MRNVRELTVVQVYLFPAGAIPLEIVRSGRGSDAVTKRFSFQTSPAPLLWPPEIPQPLGAHFINGENRVIDRTVTVPRLVFEQRRLLLTVLGSSQDADAVFEAVTAVLSELAPDRPVSPHDVVYKAEETTCIAELDFDFSRLFRPKVTSFLKKRVKSVAAEPKIAAKVWPVRFSARISYDVRDERIRGHGITLNPKEFTIEPRADTPLQEHLYYTKSPFRSDTHLRLLEEFEELFRES